MDDYIFCQDPELGSGRFMLRDERLIIVEGGSGGKQRVIDIGEISPDYQQSYRRFPQSYIVPLVLSGLCLAASWKLFISSTSNIALFFAIVTGFLGIVFLCVMEFSPVEVAQFRDTRGAMLFEVIRPKKNAHEYDEFLSILVKRIKNKSDNQ